MLVSCLVLMYIVITPSDHLTNNMAFRLDRGTCGGSHDRAGDTLGVLSPTWLDRHPAVVGSTSGGGDGDGDGGDAPIRRGLVRQMSDDARRQMSQLVAVEAIWNSFFSACGAALSEAHARGWVRREEVEDSEPYLFLGVPGERTGIDKGTINLLYSRRSLLLFFCVWMCT